MSLYSVHLFPAHFYLGSLSYIFFFMILGILVHCLISSFYLFSQATGWESQWKEKASVTCNGAAGWFQHS